jgi:hypothetical protein
MYKKIMAIMGVAVAASLMSLSIVSVAFADSTAVVPGSNAETALNITGDWATIQPGASVWYGFNYAGDASQIQLILNEQGMTGLAFDVLTPERLAQYEAGNAIDPIGSGSQNVDVPGGDLFWTGNFDLPADYYVRVDNNTMSAMSYSLGVNGSGVAMLPGTVPVAASAPATTMSASAAPAAPALPGSNAETALPINGAWTTLQPGASLWFGFNYAGDASQIQLILNEQGLSGLAFGVWTPDRVAQYEAGAAVDPIGRGSPNADVSGADLFWTGNFDIPAVYFVRVDNNGTSPIAFSLTMTGSGVW